MEILIRKADPKDLNILLEFEQGLIRAERPFDPLLRDPVNYYDIENMMASANVQLLVAECQGKLIGCGYARMDESKHYMRHTHHAYLGFMYVLPEHRGKGVNKMIIEQLREWADERGLTEMRLEVYHENHSAVQAYAKAGFEPYLLQMRSHVKNSI